MRECSDIYFGFWTTMLREMLIVICYRKCGKRANDRYLKSSRVSQKTRLRGNAKMSITERILTAIFLYKIIENLTDEFVFSLTFDSDLGFRPRFFFAGCSSFSDNVLPFWSGTDSVNFPIIFVSSSALEDDDRARRLFGIVWKRDF
jgi:hypothetical protein